MIKYAILISFLFGTLGMKAHQADVSSTMLVQQGDSWLLQIRASLTAFEYGIEAHYGKNAYDTPEAFQQLVFNHLKDNLILVFNGQDTAVFKNIQVKLGHETNVIFEVSNVPKTIKTVEIKNGSFKDIHHNQSAFFVLKDGIEKEQFILNNENQHSVKLRLENTKFILVENKFNLLYLAIGGILLLLVGVLVYFKRRTKKV